jgi:hypothetical protein
MKRFSVAVLALALVAGALSPSTPLRVTAQPLRVTAQAAVAPSAVPAPIVAPNFPVEPTTRDGSHDFDFAFGTWRTHYRILRHRLAGDHVWYDCYGTSVIRPFWGGSGNLEDGDLKCPNRYVGGMTLRTYDPSTHQWTLWWGTRKLLIAPPGQLGHFNADGVGEFYAYDSWQGKPEITRFQWTKVNGNPHFEQAYSTDGGKTWETNWITDCVRVSPTSKGVWNAADPPGVGSHDFDFLLGSWKTHYMRLKHPLTADHESYACEGTSVVRAFWGGSADIEDGDLRCPSQYIRGVTVRLYDTTKRQWALYWGTQKNGLAPGLPQIGRFNANGVGDFLAPDTYHGKPILVRYRWFARANNPRFEEAFSPDNGKSWETVWTTDYTRV